MPRPNCYYCGERESKLPVWKPLMCSQACVVAWAYDQLDSVMWCVTHQEWYDEVDNCYSCLLEGFGGENDED